MITFNQWAALLSKKLGVKVHYKQVSVDKYDDMMSWCKGIGRELGEMYAYCAEFGFDGAEPGIMPIHEVSKERINGISDCLTNLAASSWSTSNYQYVPLFLYPMICRTNISNHDIQIQWKNMSRMKTSHLSLSRTNNSLHNPFEQRGL